MTVPPYQPLPDDLTGTVEQAVVYLNIQFRRMGMHRDLNMAERTYAGSYAQEHLGYVPGQPVTGRMVNGIGALMGPYVERLIGGRPFEGAPFCETCPTPYSYDQALPWTTMPAGFILADLWGREVPGAPAVPRGSSKQPQKVLTYLLYAYPQAFWPAIFDAHISKGYNRFYVSWPDARDAGGYSIQQFVDMCGEVSARLSCGAFLSAKGRYAGNDIDGDTRDMSVQQYQDRVGPVLSALLGADVIAEAVVAWEMDQFNVPGSTTQGICTWVGQQCHAATPRVECSVHFSPEKWAWQEDGKEGAAFWAAVGSDVDNLNYQSDPRKDIGWVQSKLVDVMRDLAPFGRTLRALELRASQQFDNASPTEREACLFAYCVACTKGAMTIMGSGNGWALP